MTQQELAQLAGCSPEHLCRILNRKDTPSRQLAMKLSELTGIRAKVWRNSGRSVLRKRWEKFQDDYVYKQGYFKGAA